MNTEEIREWLLSRTNSEYEWQRINSSDSTQLRRRYAYTMLNDQHLDLNRLLVNGDISEEEHLQSLSVISAGRRALMAEEGVVTPGIGGQFRKKSEPKLKWQDVGF